MFKKNNQIILFIAAIILFVFISSCGKNENQQQNQGLIPNVPVDIWLQPNTIDYMPAGTWRYENDQGYRGIIIYRLDQATFMAYERTCPFDPNEECARVDVDPSSFTLIDSCCMSRYNIIDGSPVSGPSPYALKQYFTEYDGNWLRVYNGI